MKVGSSHDHPDNRGVWVEIWIIDLVGGDLSCALLLSQLLWWHQPGKSRRPKLRYERDGHLWLTRADDDWWRDCRLTHRQVDRIKKRLRELDLVEIRRIRTPGGATISAWRPNESVIQEAEERWEEREPGSTRVRTTGATSAGTQPGTSDDEAGSTPTGTSGTYAEEDDQWKYANGDDGNHANADVPSLDPDLEGKKEPLAPQGAQGDDFARAQSIVDGWVATDPRRTVNSRLGVSKVVEEFLAAGYPDEVMRAALDSAKCPTKNALLVVLNGSNGHAPDNRPAVPRVAAASPSDNDPVTPFSALPDRAALVRAAMNRSSE